MVERDKDGGILRPWQKLAAAGQLAEAVVEFARRYHGITLPELEGFLEPYMEIRGDLSWELGDTKAVLWAGMSREFLDLLLSLIKKKKLFVHPASALTYLFDGQALNLPIAQRLSKGGYKKPHWLPVSLWVVPPAQKPEGRKKTQPAAAKR